MSEKKKQTEGELLEEVTSSEEKSSLKDELKARKEAIKNSTCLINF